MAKPVSILSSRPGSTFPIAGDTAADAAVGDAKSPISATMQSDSITGEAVIASVAGSLF